MPEVSLEIDASSALIQGSRETQEDAIASDFPIGAGCGLVVLADGMGGHLAGEIASNIVVTEVYSELKLQSSQLTADHTDIPAALRNAAASANECLRRHCEINPETKSMGTTLVAVVQLSNALHWISIGDSLLFLFRNGELRRLNEDHSLASQIDLMVKKGVLPQEVGEHHPQRNCLTSALTGEPIPNIDCPDTPLKLLPGDVVIVASDGLQFLSDKAITTILNSKAHLASNEIAKAFVNAITELDDPDQDNVSCSVAKVFDPGVLGSEVFGVRAPKQIRGADCDGSADQQAVPPESSKSQEPVFHRLRRLTGNLFW